MPFLNLGMLGRAPNPRNYQYHQVCLGIAAENPRHYVHAQLPTLKAAMVHLVFQSLPLHVVAATRVRPKGASVHDASLIPMGASSASLTATAEGKRRDIEGLYFADGATFPFLPEKNITLTPMANAVRVATAAC